MSRMAITHVEQVREHVESCGRSGMPVGEYTATVVELLRRAVPFDAICLATTDPGTGLITGARKVDLPDSRDREFAHLEYEVDDVNHYREIALRPEPVGVLALDTGGHPERSTRWREFLVPHFGFGHELRAAFRTDGQVWGLAGLYRDSASSGFSPAEADFVGRLSGTIGRGMRTAIVTAQATAPRHDSGGPAVLVVGRDGELRSATPAALDHLDRLSRLGSRTDDLPTPVHVLAAAARSVRDGRLDAVPRTRLRLASGEWVVLHAAPLAGPTEAGEVVVTMEPARPPDVVPLVVAAHGLTDRERDVVALVLTGATTTDIGRQLHLSPYTIQDHLKSIFDKAGVHSRRELTARVFYDHYAPQLGDPLGPSGWFAG